MYTLFCILLINVCIICDVICTHHFIRVLMKSGIELLYIHCFTVKIHTATNQNGRKASMYSVVFCLSVLMQFD